MKDIYQWISEIVPVNATIFEIGCSTGTDTKRLAALPGAIVHAFEPEPRCTFDGWPSNIIINKVAVSDAKGKAKFYMGESKNYHPWTFSSSILEPKNHLEHYKYVQFPYFTEVDTIRLDDYCKENNVQAIDFIWMDVQGAEHKVIAGATEILKRTKYIYTEYDDREMYEGQKPLSYLLEQLKTFEILEDYPGATCNVLLKNTAL